MAESASRIKQNRPVWTAFIGSLVFHVILLLFWMLWGRNMLFPAYEPPLDREIAVEFLQEPERRSHEIVETPEDSRVDKAPDEARFASDKNARSRDRNQDRVSGADPYQQGVYDTREPARNPGSPEAASAGRPQQDAVNTPGERPERSPEGSLFSRERLLGQQASPRPSRKASPAGSAQPTVPHEQTRTSAEDFGGFSFNTYAWDFAPYMLDLKNRIQKNIYPPPAFTHLGFGGQNLIRFRIYPDGRLESVEVVGWEGEKALVETSRKAVMTSAPFARLPEEFPEPFLEVTARFTYNIFGR